MGRRMVSWWEALPGRRHVLYGIPAAFMVLYGFHQAFFPLLDWQQSATYALMECVPISLLLAWATQNELRRRAHAQERGTGGTDSGIDSVDPLDR